MPDRTATDELPPLVGLRGAADILGVDPTNVRRTAGLPAPREMERGPVWVRSDIEAFAEERAAPAAA